MKKRVFKGIQKWGSRNCLFSGIVVGVLIALTLWSLFPVLSHFNSTLVGDGWDASLFTWDLWWMREAVMERRVNPFYCDALHLPIGSSLLFHTFVPLYGLLTIPLQHWLSAVQCYNLLIIFIQGLSFLAMYLLARQLSLSRTAALFSSVAFTLSPIRMARIGGHINLFSTQWMSLYLWSWLLFRRNTRPLHLLFAGFFLCCSLLTSYQLTVVMLITQIAFFPFDKDVLNSQISYPASLLHNTNRKKQTKQAILNSLAALLLVTLIAGIMLTPFLLAAHQAIIPGLDFDLMGPQPDVSRFAPKLLYYCLPWSNSLLGELVLPYVPQKYHSGIETVLSPGLFVWMLCIIFMITRFRKSSQNLFSREIIWFFTVALFLYMLSWGKSLHLFQIDTGIPLPFAVFRHLPLLKGMTMSNRFAFGSAFLLSLLAGMAIHTFTVKMRPQKGIWVSLPLFLILVCETFPIRIPLQTVHFAPSEREIFRHKVVFSIPFGIEDSYFHTGYTIAHYRMLHQTHEGGRITSGHMSRMTEQAKKYFLNNDFLRIVSSIQEKGVAPEMTTQQMSQAVRDWIDLCGTDVIRVNSRFMKRGTFKPMIGFLKAYLPPDSFAVRKSPECWTFLITNEKKKSVDVEFRERIHQTYLFGTFQYNESEKAISFFNSLHILVPAWAKSQKVMNRLSISLPERDYQWQKPIFVSLKQGSKTLAKAKLSPGEKIARISFFTAPQKWELPFITMQVLTEPEPLRPWLSNIPVVHLVSVGGNAAGNPFSSISVEKHMLPISGRGINMCSIDSRSGRITRMKNYDTCGSSRDTAQLLQVLKALPTHTVICLVVEDDASVSLGQAVLKELEKFGLPPKTRLHFRQAFCMIGKRGIPSGSALMEIGNFEASLSSHRDEILLHSLHFHSASQSP